MKLDLPDPEEASNQMLTKIKYEINQMFKGAEKWMIYITKNCAVSKYFSD